MPATAVPGSRTNRAQSDGSRSELSADNLFGFSKCGTRGTFPNLGICDLSPEYIHRPQDSTTEILSHSRERLPVLKLARPLACELAQIRREFRYWLDKPRMQNGKVTDFTVGRQRRTETDSAGCSHVFSRFGYRIVPKQLRGWTAPFDGNWQIAKSFARQEQLDPLFRGEAWHTLVSVHGDHTHTSCDGTGISLFGLVPQDNRFEHLWTKVISERNGPKQVPLRRLGPRSAC
jgi:hypothetical protein